MNPQRSKPPSRRYRTNNGTLLYASPLRDNYKFSNPKSEIFFDICIRNNGEPESEAELIKLLKYSAHKFAGTVTTFDGQPLEDL